MYQKKIPFNPVPELMAFPGNVHPPNIKSKSMNFPKDISTINYSEVVTMHNQKCLRMHSALTDRRAEECKLRNLIDSISRAAEILPGLFLARDCKVKV